MSINLTAPTVTKRSRPRLVLERDPGRSADADPRRDHRQRRTARDAHRARLQHLEPVLGDQRVRACLRGPASPRRRDHGDILGRRTTFLAGIGTFTVGLNRWWFRDLPGLLLAARAVQGAGAAFAAPAALALLDHDVSRGSRADARHRLLHRRIHRRQRRRPRRGRILIQFASWRWVMFVNAPIGVAVIVIGFIALPKSKRAAWSLRPRRSGHLNDRHDRARLRTHRGRHVRLDQRDDDRRARTAAPCSSESSS